MIPEKLLCNFVEITLPHGHSPANSQDPLRKLSRKNTSVGLLLCFLRQIDYSNNSTNPKATYVVSTNLRGQFLGFYLLIAFLKMFKKIMFLSSSGIKLQIIGRKYLVYFDPFSTVLICGITKSNFQHR